VVRRDFQQRYVGSVAGWLWGVVHPLVLLAVYTFLFVYAFRVPLPEGAVTDNYPLFLFAGMAPWLLFSEALQRSATSLLEYSNLIKRSVFPSEVVPLSIFLSTLIGHLLVLLMLLAAVAAWLGRFSPTVVVLPAYMVLLGLFALGLSWVVAGLNVYIRDTAQVLSVALTAWFWLTPIFLFEEMFRERFEGRLAFLLKANPLVYVVRAYRETILGNQIPSGRDFLLLGAFALASFLAGGLFFRHAKRGFADVL
jgi:ABC-type polysaccharide/polyol phosphate export permease